MDKLVPFRAAAFFGLAASLAVFPATQAVAQKVDFAGKRVEMLVPFNPGGGSDVYSRALAPFFEKYLPGNPTIVIDVSRELSWPGIAWKDRSAAAGWAWCTRRRSSPSTVGWR